MQDVILPCQNPIACPLSQSFDRKLTNKNPFCAAFLKENPFEKICNIENPQTPHIFFQNDKEI